MVLYLDTAAISGRAGDTVWFLEVAMLFLPICYGLVGVRGCGMHWCLGWLASCTGHAGAGSGSIFSPFGGLRRFRGGQGFGALIYLNGRAESEMHLSGLFLAGADICGFLYSSIGCLQVYRVYITSFWFHSKLVLQKAKKPKKQPVRQHLHIMFISNNHASFDLWWKENLVKHQEVSKHENDRSYELAIYTVFFNVLHNAF